jgi:CBS domain-containing protein
MRVVEVCTRSVVTCRRETSALELAQIMRDRHVRDVIVVDERETGPSPIGIVTDRDLVVLVLANGVSPDGVQAGNLLKGDLVTALQSDDIYDAIWCMRNAAVRCLPIVNSSNSLVGVLTLDDVTRVLAEAVGEVGRISLYQAKKEEAALERERHASARE